MAPTRGHEHTTCSPRTGYVQTGCQSEPCLRTALRRLPRSRSWSHYLVFVNFWRELPAFPKKSSSHRHFVCGSKGPGWCVQKRGHARCLSGSIQAPVRVVHLWWSTCHAISGRGGCFNKKCLSLNIYMVLTDRCHQARRRGAAASSPPGPACSYTYIYVHL